MKVNIQVERRTESLEQRYRASAGGLFRITCLLNQMHGNGAINDTQHMARDQRAVRPPPLGAALGCAVQRSPNSAEDAIFR